jgi:hypothetical protein
LQAIGSKLPNELGLYDMTGNAEEWCQDYYATLPSDAVKNYAGPTTSTSRVLKGGRYDLGTINNVINDRVFSSAPYLTAANRGLRVARNGQPLYTVKYDRNGGWGTIPVDLNRYDPTMQVTVPSGSVLSRCGQPAVAWNTAWDGSGYSVGFGSNLSMASGSKTLYGYWDSSMAIAQDGNMYFTTNTATNPSWSTAADLSPHETILKSGAISANQDTIIEYTLTSGMPYFTGISFNRKTNNSIGSLQVELFFNGVPQALQGITAPWQELSPWTTSDSIPLQDYSRIEIIYPLTVRWTYKKDADQGTGGDAAWIDDIVVTTSTNS